MRGGDFVLMARRRAGLPQRELGDRLGLRQATIARWECGERQVSLEDVEAVAAACGLHLQAHLVAEDRSWWSQIALQLDLDPLDRLRRLAPTGSPDLAEGVEAIAGASAYGVLVGEVAGALQGWPLVLSGGGMKVCSYVDDGAPVFAKLGRRVGRHRYELPGGATLHVVDAPAGTHGFEDLRRGSDLITTPGGDVRVASVIDLLRIADASRSKTACRDALAYQAVLDVLQAQRKRRPPDDRSLPAKIDATLRGRSPIPTSTP
jgi:transcriptional regulator with XRE-family HTH domain